MLDLLRNPMIGRIEIPGFIQNVRKWCTDASEMVRDGANDPLGLSSLLELPLTEEIGP